MKSYAVLCAAILTVVAPHLALAEDSVPGDGTPPSVAWEVSPPGRPPTGGRVAYPQGPARDGSRACSRASSHPVAPLCGLPEWLLQALQLTPRASR